MTDLTHGILIGMTSIITPFILGVIVYFDYRWGRGWHGTVPLFGNVHAETFGRADLSSRVALFGFGRQKHSIGIGYVVSDRTPLRPWPTVHRATESGRSLVYGVTWFGLAMLYVKPNKSP